MPKSYSAYVFPNIARDNMGSRNPYVDNMKTALASAGFVIDPAPSNYAFLDFLLKAIRSDVVVLNWVENIPMRRAGALQTMVFIFYMHLLRLLGTRIIWIRHNKAYHDIPRFPFLMRQLEMAMISLSNQIITHAVDPQQPRPEKTTIIPHPNSVDPADVLQPRKDDPTPIDFLIWGTIIPYKGILEFLTYVSEHPEFSHFKIHIVGKSRPVAYGEELKRFAGPNIEVSDKYLPWEELRELFGKSKFILFTYNKETVLSSGVLIDSLVACKRIIGPDTGAFKDLADDRGFVSMYHDFSDIFRIHSAYADDYLLDRSKVIDYFAENSWARMGEKLHAMHNLSKKHFLMAPLLALCLGVLCPHAARSQQVQTFFVAPGGTATNPGTQTAPFSTPDQALQAIHALSGPVNATVYFRAGHYAFSKSFVYAASGSDTLHQITFAGFQREKVVFSGSVVLPGSGFQLVKDPGTLSRLPVAARGKVYQMDIHQNGVSDVGQIRQHGSRTINPAPMELFYNGEVLTPARWPATGLAPIGQVLDPGTNVRQGEKNYRGAAFAFSDPEMKRWTTASNAWIGGQFSNGYYDDVMKVDTFDVSGNVIRTKQPSLYQVFSSYDSSNGPLKTARALRGFYVFNLLEELNTPGQYYMDSARHILYIWPPDNAVGKADIEVSLLEDPIVVLSHTKNVTFSGIAFKDSRGIGLLLDNTKNTRVVDCVFDGLGTVAISTGNQLNARKKVYSVASGDGFPPYNTHLDVESCTITNTGTGGILLMGGDRKNLIPANNVVNNCEISNYARINQTYCPAVSLDGVGNSVTHCYIHDAPDQAILFQGNNHTISYNHIKSVVSAMTDAGAMYTFGDLSSTGTVISYNFFEDINGPAGTSVSSVYMDNGSGGIIIDNNVFYNACTSGTYHFGAVDINGGADTYVRNNYFVNCAQAFSNTQWNDPGWRSYITNAANLGLYAHVDIRSPVYAAAYPQLAQLVDSNQIAPRHNYSFNTLVYNVHVFSVGGSLVHENVVTTTQDPGFMDAAHGNFTLVKFPPALESAGGWKPIPFNEIGPH